MRADLVAIGGGLGGVAAALTAARLGRDVIIVEPAPWLGGQLTTQAVPPDEHPWIEGELASPSYRGLRETIRDHYRRAYPLTPRAREWAELNPGMGFVSRLCHEPRVAALAIEELMSPHLASGRITVLRGYETMSVARAGRLISSVRVRSRASGAELDVSGRLFADATEEGEFLPLAGAGFVVGAEARADTGELHAPQVADPLDQQAISWCAAVEYRPGENHTIDRPANYEHWRNTVDARWPGPQLSWADLRPETLAERVRPLFAESPEAGIFHQADDLWQYRRILSKANLDPSFPGGEITLVNWPQIDYWELPLIGDDPDARTRALAGARELTHSFIHWMQTEAPRHDVGRGYPELRLRGDVLGTADGLAQQVYVRESRRIRALFTVTEAHIGRQMRGADAGSEVFDDSVGIGYYRIDLHPSASGRNYVDIDSFPFQIPLGALVHRDVDNLVAAAKNIGTTHITNGAYRLHPVEWSIGEAVGALADRVAATGLVPAEVHADPRQVRDLQALLERLGVTLAWPEEIRTGGRAFDSVTTMPRRSSPALG